MSNFDSFSQSLFPIIEEKIKWYDSSEMPKLLQEYQKFHSHVSNIFSVLIKKGVITADPYKKDKKISDITLIEDSNFLENERLVVIGKRLSDFESILDYICNYVKFSVQEFPPDRIKKLLALNSCFQWNSLSTTNPKPSTRGLAISISSVKQSGDSLSANVLQDGVQNISKCISVINTKLKDINDFQRELYKVEIRKSVFEHPQYSHEKSASSPQEAMIQIKKLFPSVMGKIPFYTELVEEVIDETYGSNQALLQKNLLAKVTIKTTSQQTSKQEDNSRESLLDAVLSLSTLYPQLEVIIAKLNENKTILENENNGFSAKLRLLFMKAFGLQEKELVYKIPILDTTTQTKRLESIEFNSFVDSLTRRFHFYSTFSTRKSPGFQKIDAQDDKRILDFLVKQISECQSLVKLLYALDDYFKNAPTIENRSKIRGMQIELASIKNSLVKTNQRRAEYAALIEEQAQMRKLGITDEI